MTYRAFTVGAAVAALGCAAATAGGGVASRSGDASVKGLIGASVQVTFRSTVQALADVPIEPSLVEEDRGRIETRYFDLTPFAFEAERYPPIERIVRYVIDVAPDTLGRGARILIRALYQPSPAPYVRGRATERLVPRDHPAVEYAEKLLERIESKAVGSD
jgi:hypothetical protein